MKSPYDGVDQDGWLEITQRLIEEHPLSPSEIVDVVLGAWDSIFATKIGSKGFGIGVDIFPKPQMMGFFLHELIPLEFAARYPNIWRAEATPKDKDVVHMLDSLYSFELKTSSSARSIFGNRSYAYASVKGKKVKSGYYLAVNFGKFVEKKSNPTIRLIRFGWIDAVDWIGQKAPTGQQSRITPVVQKLKLIELYPGPSE